MSANLHLNSLSSPSTSAARPWRVGLIGFGCVGQGLYDILQKRPETGFDISRIVVKNQTKERTLPANRFEFDAAALLADDTLDVLVEVIDDAEEAFRLVAAALRRGRRVVTANKAMLARHLPELVQLQREGQGTLLYEAAVCGSIPVIRTLDAYFGAEPLRRLTGILNGSSNYVLTRMGEDSSDYAPALAEAQAKGFAETDPSLDMGAFDPRSKAVLLAAHAYGAFLQPEQVLNLGIEGISAVDIAFAATLGQKIKVVAGLQRLPDGRVTALVTPQLVGPDSPLYSVDNEFNGVVIEADFAGEQFLRGRGAGGHPTGSAVLADLAALRQGFAYQYPKARAGAPAYASDLEVEIYLRTDEDRLIDLLDFSEISEEADEDEYVVGYVALENLIRHRDTLRKYGAFVVRTGQLRPISTAVAAVVEEESF
ncbi:homoserine dehydrogenase [Hymenobacter taeanensis]|uniref:Homoserine dehydrogenase n=1 Tax=Hymenobacter taeanensis TaxID=2735321 RepID=A0A6M6BE44_9BACT|nr:MULTISPECIES: homoserine dehydrogenase [Hymenobacter]QJX46260.1 homoserine dehydrogenase [Hymenobacter taeanensis]UOQ80114.1 homoserine dehydrogenase [Hymenobacter sp. 5414T-23]